MTASFPYSNILVCSALNLAALIRQREQVLTPNYSIKVIYNEEFVWKSEAVSSNYALSQPMSISWCSAITFYQLLPLWMQANFLSALIISPSCLLYFYFLLFGINLFTFWIFFAFLKIRSWLPLRETYSNMKEKLFVLFIIESNDTSKTSVNNVRLKKVIVKLIYWIAPE